MGLRLENAGLILFTSETSWLASYVSILTEPSCPCRILPPCNLGRVPLSCKQSLVGRPELDQPLHVLLGHCMVRWCQRSKVSADCQPRSTTDTYSCRSPPGAAGEGSGSAPCWWRRPGRKREEGGGRCLLAARPWANDHLTHLTASFPHQWRSNNHLAGSVPEAGPAPPTGQPLSAFSEGGLLEPLKTSGLLLSQVANQAPKKRSSAGFSLRGHASVRRLRPVTTPALHREF